MELIEVCVDTNVVIGLFKDPDFHPLRLMKLLHHHRLHLSITEIALSQAFIGGPAEERYQRFCNLVAFARSTGHEYFSIGAPLKWIHEQELSFPTYEGIPMVPRHVETEHEKILARAASFAEFEEWHRVLDAEVRAYLDPDDYLARDKRVRQTAREEHGLDTQVKCAAWLRAELPKVPTHLHENWLLETLVPDEALRARVVAEPHRCPSLVATALAFMLTGIGAITDPRGEQEFKDLKISKDSWTDARILGESVYAGIFVTGDHDLRGRAGRIKAWGFFQPRVTTWEDLTA